MTRLRIRLRMSSSPHVLDVIDRANTPIPLEDRTTIFPKGR